MITIVIPAYNEERRLSSTVEAFAKFFPEEDVLVVPNGCTDNTESVANRLAKKFRNVRVVSTPVGGKGRAVRLGFSHSKGDFVGFVDADLAIVPEEFAKLLPYLNDFDCTIASRRAKGAVVAVKEPLPVRLASRILNLLVRAFFSLNVYDTQCGAKIFRTEIIKNILPECFVDKMAFDVELLWRVKKAGGSIKEVPIVWRHNASDSKTGVFKTGIRMFFNLVQLRWKG